MTFEIKKKIKTNEKLTGMFKVFFIYKELNSKDWFGDF